MAAMLIKSFICVIVCVAVASGVPVVDSPPEDIAAPFMSSPFVAYDPSALGSFVPGPSFGVDYLKQEAALNKAYTKAFTSGTPIGLVVPARVVTPDGAAAAAAAPGSKLAFM